MKSIVSLIACILLSSCVPSTNRSVINGVGIREWERIEKSDWRRHRGQIDQVKIEVGDSTYYYDLGDPAWEKRQSDSREKQYRRALENGYNPDWYVDKYSLQADDSWRNR